jgi:hypothetical protein
MNKKLVIISIFLTLFSLLFSSFVLSDYSPQLVPNKIYNQDGGIYYLHGQNYFMSKFIKNDINKTHISSSFSTSDYKNLLIGDFFDLFPDENKVSNMNLQIVSFSGTSISFYGYNQYNEYNIINSIDMGNNIIDVIVISNPTLQTTSTYGRKDSLIVILENMGTYKVIRYSFDINTQYQITPVLEHEYISTTENLTQKTYIDCDYYSTFDGLQHFCGFASNSNKIITFGTETKYNKIINFINHETAGGHSTPFNIVNLKENLLVSKGGTYDIIFVSDKYTYYTSYPHTRQSQININYVDIDGLCDSSLLYCEIDYDNDVHRNAHYGASTGGVGNTYHFHTLNIIGIEKTYFSVAQTQPKTICLNNWGYSGSIDNRFTLICETDGTNQINEKYNLGITTGDRYTTKYIHKPFLTYYYDNNNYYLTYNVLDEIKTINLNTNTKKVLIDNTRGYILGASYLYNDGDYYLVYFNQGDSKYYSYNLYDEEINQLSIYDGLPFARMYITDLHKETLGDIVFNSITTNYIFVSDVSEYSVTPTPETPTETLTDGLPFLFNAIKNNIKLIIGLILVITFVVTLAGYGITNPIVLLLAGIIGLVISSVLGLIPISILIIMLISMVILLILSMTIFKNVIHNQ